MLWLWFHSGVIVLPAWRGKCQCYLQWCIVWRAQRRLPRLPLLSLRLIQTMFTLGVFSDVQLGVDDCVTTACFDYRNHCCCGCGGARYQSAIGWLQSVFVCFSSFNSQIRFPDGISPSPLGLLRACSHTAWLSDNGARLLLLLLRGFIFFSYVRRMSHLRFLSLLLHLQICLFKHLPLVP